MDSISHILQKFNPIEDKYISREYQSYGIYLAEELEDWKHKALYIKLAKQIPRAILEKAFSFAKDSKAKRKGAYFMWKLKEMGGFKKSNPKSKTRLPDGQVQSSKSRQIQFD